MKKAKEITSMSIDPNILNRLKKKILKYSYKSGKAISLSKYIELLLVEHLDDKMSKKPKQMPKCKRK